jgi:hypothetical protein
MWESLFQHKNILIKDGFQQVYHKVDGKECTILAVLFSLLIPGTNHGPQRTSGCLYPAVQAILGAASRFPANKGIIPRNINIVTYSAARRPSPLTSGKI